MKKGIGVGYYYSLGSNGYTSRLKLNATELEAIEIQQMTELWTTYGNNGNLTELVSPGCPHPSTHPPTPHKHTHTHTHTHTLDTATVVRRGDRR